MSALYRVLLVEKQQQMIHVYKNMIPWEESGFQIASVADSESDALALYGEYKYDVIFTALDLQGGNGVSLIKKLRHLGPECIVVVISGRIWRRKRRPVCRRAGKRCWKRSWA